MANKKVASNKTPLWSEHTRLSKAVNELNDLNETHGIVMRGGKKYLMVQILNHFTRQFKVPLIMG